MKSIGLFIQNQLLKMDWLNSLVVKCLNSLGLDTSSKLGGSVEFFIFDVIKISILLCVLIFIISYIQSFFPADRSKRILGRFKGIGANIIAALLGTVTPFCSCSSIPLFIGFSSAGLPLGVTFSFLISSPMVDLGSLILLISIFGFRIAFVYFILGIVVAVIGGTMIEKLGLENEIEDFIIDTSKNLDDSPIDNSYKMSVKNRILYSRNQVFIILKKVFIYILIGVGIGAVIHNWIPEVWVEKSVGTDNMFGVFLATLVGIPMYADIFGAIPVAEALLSKGAMLGTVLSFMMAVTTLSLPSMIMLRKAVKPKLLTIFIIIVSIGIIFVGYFFYVFQNLFI